MLLAPMVHQRIAGPQSKPSTRAVGHAAALRLANATDVQHQASCPVAQTGTGEGQRHQWGALAAGGDIAAGRSATTRMPVHSASRAGC